MGPSAAKRPPASEDRPHLAFLLERSGAIDHRPPLRTYAQDVLVMAAVQRERRRECEHLVSGIQRNERIDVKIDRLLIENVRSASIASHFHEMPLRAEERPAIPMQDGHDSRLDWISVGHLLTTGNTGNSCAAQTAMSAV